MGRQWTWMVVAVLALAGCSNGGGGGSGEGTTSSSKPISGSGGTVSIWGATVAIASGTFVNPVAVTLEKTSDPTLHAVFQESAAVAGPTAQLDASEYKVRMASSPASASGGMDLTVSVSAPMAAAIKSGTDVSLVYINRYQSDDDESGESVDSVESIPAVFDGSRNILKATIPLESFSSTQNGSLEAVFKIMVDDGSGATIQAMSTRKHVQAATIASCTCAAPTVPKLYKKKYYICVPPDSGTSLVSPLGGQLKVIGPYAETAGHTTVFHAGVDFRSAVGSPTKAVRSGYIESAHILNKSGQVLIIRHFDDTWSRYLHLVPGSVLNVPKNTNNESVYQWKPSQCATPDYMVSQGDVVAQTGDSGSAATGKPHLHFEYGFSAAVASVNTLNPILNGLASLGSVVLSDAQTQQPLPSTGLSLSAVLKSGDALDNINNSRFIHVGVFDSANQEILVRRKKHKVDRLLDYFLPVTAQGTNFEYAPIIGYSNTPVVKVDVTLDDALLSGVFTSGSSVFPDYPLSGLGLVTSPVGAIFSPNNDLASKAGLKSDGGDVLLAASAMPPSSASSAAATVHVKVSGVHRVQDSLNGVVNVAGNAYPNNSPKITQTEPGTWDVQTSVRIGTGFTKISASGQDLPSDAPTWSCVRHNATGLLWEAHVTRQTPAHPCAWDPTLTCTGYTNFGDGSAYDASAVTGSVCGKPGRLPTVDEGTALVNDPAYAAANPTPGAFMTTWFGADDIAWWGWTSSPVVGSPSVAWYVYFGYGYVNYVNRYYGYYVRLVAGP